MDQITPSKIEGYLKRNWFQIGMLLILVLALAKKDEPFKSSEISGHSTKIALTAKNQNSIAKKETMGFGFLMPSTEKSKEVKSSKVVNAADEAFVTRFSEAAKTEAEKFEVPASVMLALGIYHRNSPKAFLAQKANNYFAIPCTADWYGASVTHEDACYRSYKSAWFSFRDQNKYLNDLKEQGMKEMKNGPYLTTGDWSRLLKRNGLIRNTSKFEQIVVQFDLTRFDEI